MGVESSSTLRRRLGEACRKCRKVGADARQRQRLRSGPEPDPTPTPEPAAPNRPSAPIPPER